MASLITVVITLFAFVGGASAQGDASVVTGLVRDLLGRDFERAHGAAETPARVPDVPRTDRARPHPGAPDDARVGPVFGRRT